MGRRDDALARLEKLSRNEATHSEELAAAQREYEQMEGLKGSVQDLIAAERLVLQAKERHEKARKARRAVEHDIAQMDEATLEEDAVREYREAYLHYANLSRSSMRIEAAMKDLLKAISLHESSVIALRKHDPDFDADGSGRAGMTGYISGQLSEAGFRLGAAAVLTGSTTSLPRVSRRGEEALQQGIRRRLRAERA